MATFSYVAYVDGAPVELRDFSCAAAPNGSDVFVCSSRLPAMSQGTHTIEVSAYIDQSERLTRTKSWPVRINLASSTSRTQTTGFANQSFVTSDGIRLRATVVSTGLENPTDFVALPDGRLLIAEREGRIRVFRGGSLLPSPALTLGDASTGEAGGLLAVTADREFETTRAVYAIYTTNSGLRLARFFESNDTLSSRAILLDGLPISGSRPRATLRMGPDGKLYLGLDDGGDANNLGDLGSYSGKVLRLNRDGTSPDDQATATPVFATGLRRPTGMGWSENGATLWLAGGGGGGSDQLQAFVIDPRSRRRGAEKRYAMPSGIAASNLAIYQANAIPGFHGNMFVADEASGSILRVRFDSSGTIAETEWLLRGQLDSIRAIGVAPDGSLYVGALDKLVRIAAEVSR